MTHQAIGTFQVTVTPVSSDVDDGAALGRLTIDKQFGGDLVGSGKGEMLSALSSVQGSGGYVAIERVSGTLHERHGSFVFQHTGTMERGAQQLSITVVPDSGSGELAGISGSFHITIVDGEHRYEFEYSLPAIAHDPGEARSLSTG